MACVSQRRAIGLFGIFMRQEPKQEKWIRPRHRIVTAIVRWPLYLYARLVFGARIRPFREQGNRAYLVLMNHQTVFDQFFVGISFRGPVYYVSTEDILSNGWISRLIRFLVAPVPIRKQTTDYRAVRQIMDVAKEGGTIAMAPEGNRTYHGRTVYINPAVSRLAKRLALPIVIYRIEGGYGVNPRWSNDVRRGSMTAGVARVIEPEEYKDMDPAELTSLIRKELWVDEAKTDGSYRSKRAAEYLERAMYVCPFCGLSAFESHGTKFTCKKCGRTATYLPTKEIEGDGFHFPYRFLADWYDAQADYIRALDLTQYLEKPMYTDTVRLSRVHLYERKELLKKEAKVQLFGDRIMLGARRIPFDEIGTVTVLGRNKLNIYCGEEVLQLKGGVRFNALKYVQIFYHHKGEKGEDNVEFLGL